MAFKIAALFGLLIVGSGIAFARPQESDAEAQRRALDGQDMFDPNPKYTYQYQVANEEFQTYIAQQESRDGDAVTGTYSYVDPLGQLITVTYTANAIDGYSETREVQENFIKIRSKPVTKDIVTTTTTAEVVKAKTSDDSDLVARIIGELTPFIKETVSTSLNAKEITVADQPAPIQAPTQVIVAAQPVAVSSTAAVESRFGSGEGNNIRVETPEYTFATDL